ncbi:MAG: hypothetical protein AB1641_22865 [Thermodesulfobacteriota bacterium]
MKDIEAQDNNGASNRKISDKIKISKSLIMINSGSFMLAFLLNITVVVWLQQYLLKRISVDEYSIYPIVVSMMVFISLLETILVPSLVRYAIEAFAVGDEKRLNQVFSTMLSLTSFSGIAILSGGIIFSWYIDSIFNIASHLAWDARIMMALLILNISADIILSPYRVGLNIQQKYYLMNIIKSLGEFFRLLILFVLLFSISTRILWVVVATIISNISVILAKVYYSQKAMPGLRFNKKDIRVDLLKKMLNFGGWNFMYMAGRTIRNNSDVIILNKFATAYDVSAFHIGRLFHRYALMSWEMIRLSTFPALTAMHSLKMEQSLKNAYLRGGRYALWIVLFIGAPLVAFREEVIILYLSEKFVVSAQVLLYLFLALPAELSDIMLSIIARARGRMKELATIYLIMQIANIILTLYLVIALKSGCVGSAFGTFITALIFEPLFLWPIGLKLVNLSLMRFIRETVIPGIIPASAVGLLYYVIKTQFEVLTFTHIIEWVAIGSLVYTGVLFGFCLQASDKKDLAEAYMKIREMIYRKLRR